MNCFQEKGILFLVILLCGAIHNSFGMDDDKGKLLWLFRPGREGVSLYEAKLDKDEYALFKGEYINVLAIKDKSFSSIKKGPYKGFSSIDYVFFQKAEEIRKTIKDQALFEPFEKDFARNNNRYVETFGNQQRLRDLENTIKYEEKQFSYSGFEWSLFVGNILFSCCVSDEYKKLFFYLAIGAGLMSFLKNFNFVREHSKLTAKIKYCQDEEKKLKKYRKKQILFEIEIAGYSAKGFDVCLYQ